MTSSPGSLHSRWPSALQTSSDQSRLYDSALSLFPGPKNTDIFFDGSTADSYFSKKPPPAPLGSYVIAARNLHSVAMAEDDEDEDEIGGASRRRRPRYRLIDDLYAATTRIDGASCGREKRRCGEQRREKRRKCGGL